MKVSGMLFDVGFERNEVFVDEVSGFVVAIGFGFQPNTTASSGSGAKVDQYRFLVGLCLSERSVGICHKVDFHVPVLRSVCGLAQKFNPFRSQSQIARPSLSRSAPVLSAVRCELTVFHEPSLFTRTSVYW
jgi:hypothetical protein